MNGKSFHEHLWDGTQLIYNRYSEGKALEKDIVAVMAARVAAEERYARDLAAIASKAHALADKGTLSSAWEKLRDAHVGRSEVHAGLAKRLQAEVVKVVQDDINKRSVKKGELFEEDKSLHAQLAKHKSATEGAWQRYMSASSLAEASRKQFHFAQQDASIPPKKLKGMETQEAKLTSEAEKAHEAYKQTLSELNAYQKTFETSLGSLLDKLQQLDDERTQLVQTVLKAYMDMHVSSTEALTKINQENAASVDAINRNADLQGWIDQNENGLSPEPLVQYEGYEAQFEDAAPGEVPNPSKIGRVFGKSLRKQGGGAAGGSPTSTENNPKKLQRQKSLSRLLGKAKAVSKKQDPPTPTGAQPAATQTTKSSSPDATSKVQPKTAAAAAAPVVAKDSANSNATKKKGKPGRRAKAAFEFIASDESEISFNVGDIITVIRVDDSGWWDCDKDGEVGLAPGNYLQFIEDAPGPSADATTPRDNSSEDHAEPNTLSPAAPASLHEEPAALSARSSKASEEDEPRRSEGGDDEDEAEPIGYVTALYDFAGDGEDELPLKVGDRVEVYADVEGWYTGTNASGKYGLCPQNFCSPLVPIEKK